MEYNKNHFAYRNVQGLKPILCKACETEFTNYGSCPTCLKNRAYNKQLVETQLFVVSDKLGEYHQDDDGHEDFKKTVLRKKNEQPFLYYGVELEISFDDDSLITEEYDEATVDLTRVLQEFSKITNGMFVYEQDGSLSNGVELISRPTSYAMWTDKDTVQKLKAGLEYLQEKGAYIEQPNGNGMHVHISNKFFDYGRTKRDARRDAYHEIDWLFQYYQDELEKLCGRKYTRFCQAKIDKLKERYHIGRNTNDSDYNAEFTLAGKMKKGGTLPSDDHYSAVTLSGPTIEARVFKSTVDYKTVLANIEMVRAFAHASRDGQLDGKTLDEILHTKDTLYLDEHIQKTRMRCAKNKETLDLSRAYGDEIEIK